jgi:ribosomal protein S12 methylthiotransferase
VFDYSDEDGTEAATLPGKVGRATVKRRYERLSALADELCAQRAEERLGSTVSVLVERVGAGEVGAGEVGAADVEGRAAHQAPEVDGSVTLVGDVAGLRVGDLVTAVVTGTSGVDLTARVSAAAASRG